MFATVSSTLRINVAQCCVSRNTIQLEQNNPGKDEIQNIRGRDQENKKKYKEKG